MPSLSRSTGKPSGQPSWRRLKEASATSQHRLGLSAGDPQPGWNEKLGLAPNPGHLPLPHGHALSPPYCESQTEAGSDLQTQARAYQPREPRRECQQVADHLRWPTSEQL